MGIVKGLRKKFDPTFNPDQPEDKRIEEREESLPPSAPVYSPPQTPSSAQRSDDLMTLLAGGKKPTAAPATPAPPSAKPSMSITADPDTIASFRGEMNQETTPPGYLDIFLGYVSFIAAAPNAQVKTAAIASTCGLAKLNPSDVPVIAKKRLSWVDEKRGELDEASRAAQASVTSKRQNRLQEIGTEESTLQSQLESIKARLDALELERKEMEDKDRSEITRIVDMVRRGEVALDTLRKEVSEEAEAVRKIFA
jgi:hypothetical protein